MPSKGYHLPLFKLVLAFSISLISKQRWVSRWPQIFFLFTYTLTESTTVYWNVHCQVQSSIWNTVSLTPNSDLHLCLYKENRKNNLLESIGWKEVEQMEKFLQIILQWSTGEKKTIADFEVTKSAEE